MIERESIYSRHTQTLQLFFVCLLLNKLDYVAGCGCDAARFAMTKKGYDFSGGLCTSSEIQLNDIHNLKCLPDRTLLILNELYPGDGGSDAKIHGVLREIKQSDIDDTMYPTIILIGSDDSCEVMINQSYLQAQCAATCQYQFEVKLKSIRESKKLVLDENPFRGNQKLDTKGHIVLREYHEKNLLKLRCAEGFELDNSHPHKKVDKMKIIKGQTNCEFEFESDSHSNCECTPRSCQQSLESRHFIVGSKIAQEACKLGPNVPDIEQQLNCEEHFVLMSHPGSDAVEIKHKGPTVRMKSCEIETNPPRALCVSSSNQVRVSIWIFSLLFCGFFFNIYI